MGKKISKISPEQRQELQKLTEEIKLPRYGSDMPALEDLFKRFCRQSGIELEDFKDFLDMMSREFYTPEMVKMVFYAIDTDGNGKLDVMEFVRYFILLFNYPFHCKVRAIFDIIDRNGNGMIDRQEMMNFYSDLVALRSYLTGSDDLSIKDIQQMFDEMDKDKNELIDRREFESHMNKHQPVLMELLDAFVDVERLANAADSSPDDAHDGQDGQDLRCQSLQ